MNNSIIDDCLDGRKISIANSYSYPIQDLIDKNISTNVYYFVERCSFVLISLYKDLDSKKITIPPELNRYYLYCYSYSLFRIFIYLSITIYSFQFFSKFKNSNIVMKKSKKKLFQKFEIFVKFIAVFDTCKALIEYFLYRGLNYYISYFLFFDFLYKYGKFNFPFNLNDEYYIIFSTIWLILYSISTTFICVIGYVLIQYKDKEPDNYNKLMRNLKLSRFLINLLIVTVMIGFVQFVLNINIAFSFSNIDTLVFWFTWKILGTIILYDRYLTKRLKIDIFQTSSNNSHKERLNTILKTLNKAKRNLEFKVMNLEFKDYLQETSLNEDTISRLSNYSELSEFKDNSSLKLEMIDLINTSTSYINLEDKVRNLYSFKKGSMIKGDWKVYCHYFFFLNIISILGYSILIFSYTRSYYHFDNGNSNYLYGIYMTGTIFVYTETIIYDFSNLMMIIHAVFGKLIKNDDEKIKSKKS